MLFLSMEKHYLGHRKRLKEKFEKNPSSLHTYEILELLLGFVIKGKDVKPQAKEIIKKCKNLEDIFHIKLADIKGIGKETELFFKIAGEFILRTQLQKIEKKDLKISKPEEVYLFLKNLIGFEVIEKFVVLYLNSQNQIIFYEIISTGTVNQTVVFPREIAKKAININAVSIIIAHNHPSGNTYPSDNDIKLTSKISESLKLFDINILDHLIVTKDSFFSFKQEALL